ncbi:MAG: bacillolysin [Bacteroidota bacterium]|nr:bacillolysin [Bacteroidota bacterium]
MREIIKTGFKLILLNKINGFHYLHIRMRQKLPLFLLCFFILLGAKAQQQPFNNGIELWKGGYFERCCGLALATPTNWGIVEQPMQMAINHFVFKETDSANVHSGNFSARLYTDTSSLDSAGDVNENIAVLVPGAIACAGMICYGVMGVVGDPRLTNAYSQGLAFTDKPEWLNFYMKINHLVPDTASYAYVFTRWDSVALKEDTLAISVQQINDDDIIQNEWLSFTDTIHYLLPGNPDTLHLIFRGGINGDMSKIGNTVWLDDVSFYYATTGLRYLDADDVISIYPNPASDLLNVKLDGALKGNSFEVYDVTGRIMKSMVIENLSFSISLNNVATGNYFYRIIDNHHAQIQNGKFSVVR